MQAYYNEIDPKAAAWLRELIKRGLIPAGDVDERSIKDVQPRDLDGYNQCHFFAGIGGWAEALRLAGWGTVRPVWTGSCPCQPFSVAGKGEGLNDDRHLWPAFRRLISTNRPDTIFGEQVASKQGREWLTEVRFDLEYIDYWEGFEKALHCLREAKSVVEISQICGQIIGWVEAFVCGLSEGLRVKLALTEQGKIAFNEGKKTRKRQDIQKKIYRKKQSEISCVTDKAEVPEKRDRFRFRQSHKGNKRAHREWPLRVDWSAFEVESREAAMEQSFFGSHRSESWIHILECAGGLFRHECGSGGLGGEGAENDCARLFGKECVNEERIITERFRTLIAASIVRLHFAGVRSDLEAMGYAVGAADLCAAGVGAPHIRQRLWWVAVSNCTELQQKPSAWKQSINEPNLGNDRRLADADERTEHESKPQSGVRSVPSRDAENSSRVGDTNGARLPERVVQSGSDGKNMGASEGKEPIKASGDSSFWWPAEYIPCADGKARRIKPGIAPLAHGLPARVVRLRGYGNAIVPQVGAEFVKAFLAT